MYIWWLQMVFGYVCVSRAFLIKFFRCFKMCKLYSAKLFCFTFKCFILYVNRDIFMWKVESVNLWILLNFTVCFAVAAFYSICINFETGNKFNKVKSYYSKYIYFFFYNIMHACRQIQKRICKKYLGEIGRHFKYLSN